MYSLAGYGEMIADDVRMAAYREALRRAVRPGSVVVDLGAGAGIMSCIAARLGATRVYAIEPSDAIGVGREIAEANGFADRVVFIQELSDRVELPEPADVLVADLRGVLPPFPGHLEAITDARKRFLKKEGVLIPARDTMWAAVVEAPDLYESHMRGWKDEEFDMAPARRRMAHSWGKARVRAGQLLGASGRWATIDYPTVESPAVRGSVTLPLSRGGTAHGLAVWFDAEVLDGVGFSNAPGRPEAIYGQAFFPFLEPVGLREGDQAEVRIRADVAEGEYVWSWTTDLRSANGVVSQSFRQSSFQHLPLCQDALRKRADTFIPHLNREGDVDRTALSKFGTGRTLGEIAGELAAAFPEQFKDWKSALDRVARLSRQYSK